MERERRTQRRLSDNTVASSGPHWPGKRCKAGKRSCNWLEQKDLPRVGTGFRTDANDLAKVQKRSRAETKDVQRRKPGRFGAKQNKKGKPLGFPFLKQTMLKFTAMRWKRS